MKTFVSNANTVPNAKQTSTPVESYANDESKRPANLNLNKAKSVKPLLLIKTTLDSPDVNTPDLEKILLSSNLLQTPQPGLVFPSDNGDVTSEQEAFTKGFETALHDLHHSKTSQSQSTATNFLNDNDTSDGTNTTKHSTAHIGMSGGSFTYTNLDSNFPVAIKDEPQNPPSSPSVSPIDMETQEKIKLERKRQRNRVAASKCRKRKLERISKLEDKVKILKGENVDLGQMVKTLKDHVAQLKQHVIEHIATGCEIPKIMTSAQ